MSIMRTSFDALARDVAQTRAEAIQYQAMTDEREPDGAPVDIPAASVIRLRTNEYTGRDGLVKSDSIVASFERVAIATVKLRDIVLWSGDEWIIDEFQTTNAKHEIIGVRTTRTELTGREARHDRRRIEREAGLGQ